MSLKCHLGVYALLAIACSGCTGTRRGVTSRPPHSPQISSDAVRESESRAEIVTSTPNDESTIATSGEILRTAGETPPAPIPEDSPVAVAPLGLQGDRAFTWTLASLESTALERNPSIRQASSSAFKAMGFRDQVGVKPNPIMGYNGSQLADRGTDQHVAFVEQQVVMGDKLSRNRAVLSQEVQSQLWEVEAQRYRVLTDVRQRYYEALAAQRRMTLTQEFLQIAEKGVEVAKARLDAKEGSTPEVLQAEIQLNQIRVQRRQAEAAFRGTWKQLMAVVGLPEVSPGSLEGALPRSVALQDLELVKNEVLSSSPELQAARARVSRARANIDRQDVQAVPNLSLMLAGGVDKGTNSGMLNAQVGLPIPIFNKNQGNISAAQAELNRACEDVRRIELSIESRIARAQQEYEAAAAAVEQYQEVILPKAEETLQLTEQAYAAGEFEFLQVLVVRKTFFDTNLEYVSSQANLALAETFLQGMVLAGGLDGTRDTELDSGLRDQTLSGQ